MRTISLSLEPKYVALLARLAKRAGSRSGAVRLLLDEYERAESSREIVEAYRAYFADPAAAKRERDLTEEMLSASTWAPQRARGARRRHAASMKHAGRTLEIARREAP